MTSYSMELLGKQRLQDLRHEAAGDRLIRTAAVKREPARPWRGRLTFAVVRRLARVAGPA